MNKIVLFFLPNKDDLIPFLPVALSKIEKKKKSILQC